VAPPKAAPAKKSGKFVVQEPVEETEKPAEPAEPSQKPAVKLVTPEVAETAEEPVVKQVTNKAAQTAEMPAVKLVSQIAVSTAQKPAVHEDLNENKNPIESEDSTESDSNEAVVQVADQAVAVTVQHTSQQQSPPVETASVTRPRSRPQASKKPAAQPTTYQTVEKPAPQSIASIQKSDSQPKRQATADDSPPRTPLENPAIAPPQIVANPPVAAPVASNSTPATPAAPLKIARAIAPPAPQTVAASTSETKESPAPAATAGSSTFESAIAAAQPAPAPLPTLQPAISATEAPATPMVPEVAFASANHPQIVMGVRGQLLPDGGTMHIRLAPPELGELQVSMEVSQGSIAAAFTTTNDQATRLLSHSLGQLKDALEATGITVGKLQVAQVSAGSSSETSQKSTDRQSSGDNSQTPDDNPAQARDQQRRELLRKMWRRVTGRDDLDLVA
jgi:flagellar hook-length control protein FliK